jgi:ADP-heptose:LPS heptosyltransferase
MPTVLSQLRSGARVAVIRLRSLGDCVLTTPAIALLKQERPDLEIGIVVEPQFTAVFEDNPDIAAMLPPAVASLRRFRPALAINLHGGTRSLWLTLLSGAQFSAGFGHYRFSSLYSFLIPRAQEILQVNRRVHTAEHLASAMFYLGVRRREIPRARLFTEPSRAHGPRAVLHPFASSPEKAWPASRFVDLARYIESHFGLDAVFIGGPADDFTPFSGFAQHRGSLEETKRLLAGAALFVGNDSGPAHMAAAFGLPQVVLFAASDPVVWAPWKTQAETIVASDGMEKLDLSTVVEALERLRVPS